jgi:hypothetical protein
MVGECVFFILHGIPDQVRDDVTGGGGNRTRSVRRLPRRFAPRNDEEGWVLKIGFLKIGYRRAI